MEETLHRALRLFGDAQKDNHYLYFELAFTHVTEWMCFLVDKSQRTEDPASRSSEGFVVLARGQSTDPVEACYPVVEKLEQMGYQ